MKTLSRVIVLSAIVLNLIHLILPFSGFSLNKNYSPLLSLFGIVILSGIFYIYSSLKNDWKFLLVIYLSFIAQNISYQLNSGVPDYINLLIFQTNFPDFILFFSVLTWWYYRVYKSQITVPAKIKG